jgi:RHS repeat-associated protein
MPDMYSTSSANYRFGFNGMIRDDDVKEKYSTTTKTEGTGNSYDFGARMYDPRVGRWLAKDPLSGKFPDISPYSFSFNDPIIFKDPDGKAPKSTCYLAGRIIKQNNNLLGKGDWSAETKYNIDAACVFNTNKLASQEYPTIAWKREWYLWAGRMVKSQKFDTKWFDMGAVVLSWNGVGWVDVADNFAPASTIILKTETREFLKNLGNNIQKDINMPLAKEFINNNTILGQSKGSPELDKQLLYNEQFYVQQQIKALGNKKDEIIGNYNFVFNEFINKIPEPICTDYLKTTKRILGTDVDFGNIKHRLTMGIVVYNMQTGSNQSDEDVLKEVDEMEKSNE